jgi:nucleoid-associated protein YgaU
MISLTDGESHSQPAAIVESTASEIGQNRTNRHATQAAPRTDELSDQGQSLLEISSHPDEIAGDDPHASEPSSDAPVTDNDAIADFVDKEQETEVMDEDELATTEPDAPSPEQQYALEHDRPPMSRSPRDELEMDEAANVQQVAGNRRTEGAPGKPPQLPRFGESRQATIESVPQRNGASDQYSEPIQGPGSRSSSVPRTAPGKSDVAEDRSLAEQRTYVVKEGDSFWSISAKQYGTGKYFRALEEFNGHRLAAYEDGRRILRPGSEILLPDPSVLRSKSAPAKQVGLQSAPHQNDGFTARKGLESSPARDTWNSRPLGANSAELRKNDDTSTTTYRVQEGDTLSVIAQRELGSSKRWQEIYELNRDKLDNRLTIKVGMELKLPAEQPVEKLVDRPRGRR